MHFAGHPNLQKERNTVFAGSRIFFLLLFSSCFLSNGGSLFYRRFYFEDGFPLWGVSGSGSARKGEQQRLLGKRSSCSLSEVIVCLSAGGVGGGC